MEAVIPSLQDRHLGARKHSGCNGARSTSEPSHLRNGLHWENPEICWEPGLVSLSSLSIASTLPPSSLALVSSQAHTSQEIPHSQSVTRNRSRSYSLVAT